MRRAASKSGPCILTSLFSRPVTQLSRRTFAVSFVEQKIEFSARGVVLDLSGPSNVVLFQNERGQLGQFSRRQFANSALNFGETQLVD